MEAIPPKAIRSRSDEDKREREARLAEARDNNERAMHNYAMSHPVEYGIGAIRKELAAIKRQVQTISVMSAAIFLAVLFSILF